MKRFLYFTLMTVIAIACQNNKEEQSVEASLTEAGSPLAMAYFGSQITEDDAVEAVLIPDKLAGTDSLRMKVVGTVDKVCQVKGCWMTMNVGQDEPMHVTFKDYSFFVPKNINGKEAVIEGYVHREVLTVDELKHYAQDEGKSQEEIDAITEDKTMLSFVADGVIVKDYEIATASDPLSDNAEHAETEEGHGEHEHAETH